MITGWEWVVILLVIAALVIWGPKKVPELARAIGQARGEFERATQDATASIKKEIEEPIKSEPIKNKPIKKTEPSSNNVLINTAKKLGISTEGKTEEQISSEIVEKAATEKVAEA